MSMTESARSATAAKTIARMVVKNTGSIEWAEWAIAHFETALFAGSPKTHLSLRKGPNDWVRHSLLFQSPYRCEACDHRFFGFRVPRHPKKDLHQHPI